MLGFRGVEIKWFSWSANKTEYGTACMTNNYPWSDVWCASGDSLIAPIVRVDYTAITSSPKARGRNVYSFIARNEGE